MDISTTLHMDEISMPGGNVLDADQILYRTVQWHVTDKRRGLSIHEVGG